MGADARALVVCFVLTASCSGTPTGTNPDSGSKPDSTKSDIRATDTRASPDAGLKLSFSSCTLLTNPSKPPSGNGYEGLTSAMAECATTKVPAKWTEPHGDTIDLFVKRYPAVQQPAKGQLWLLVGGPGGAGVYYAPLAFLIAKSVPSLALDIYLPDHRGTGKSSFAGCSSNGKPSTAAKCAAGIPHLDGLTATDAARDLAAMIDATRTPSQKVFVLGGSYGTYWAQRYLQVRPDQPTAVILDSTTPAVGADYSMEKITNDRALAILALCEADTTCSAKLGPDPVAKTGLALAALDAGQCAVSALALNGIPARRMFAWISGSRYFERLLLPAAAYRALRCNAADQQWLETVFKYVPGEGPWTFDGFSMVVQYNIVFSELWPSNPTVSDLLAQEKTMLIYDGWPASMAAIAPNWPTYPHDAYYGNWPASTVPMLVLQSTLAPWSSVLKPHYSGPNQYYVALPKASDDVLDDRNAPMADPTACGCGRQIMQSFLSDPTRPPDTSCTTKMAPLDWGNPPAWWLARVGITDLWENP